MNHNKAQFIVDNYIEVVGNELDKATALLNAAGVLYIVEPWGSDSQYGPEKYRIYVRKDVAHVLEMIGREAKNDRGTNGTGVPKPDKGAI